ncbi:type II toxin-antitoxin system RelE/ParE family toxin [Pseudomonas huanghezhanensis]|uniref:type II toxin-antitoxin system RelE/ParE family toxin n=1 Tax=Pseudomonas huanghezhanensis TaxID=3002903 RepID=UPI002285F7E4|nr:type II toxin-antitoxin system RelE/ParE family toxin [Pseudomonas sp. BSw22131]
MLKIALTEKAQSDLDGIHEYCASVAGGSAASAVILRMLEVLEQLGTFSGMGHPSQTPGVRELVFPRHPFIAPYRVKKNQVQILRVLHHRAERTLS